MVFVGYLHDFVDVFVVVLQRVKEVELIKMPQLVAGHLVGSIDSLF